MNLLVIKANNRPASQAISSRMYETFIEALETNDKVNVTTYDVFEEDTPYIGQELFSGLMKAEAHEQMTEYEERLLKAQNKARRLFEEADTIAFVFPLWNLTIPAKLQTVVDYIFSVGYSFRYDQEGNMIQLMNDKKVIILNARGGIYSSKEMQPLEMAVNYMKTTFNGVLGMEILDEVIIEGHSQDPVKSAEIIEQGMTAVKEAARKLA